MVTLPCLNAFLTYPQICCDKLKVSKIKVFITIGLGDQLTVAGSAVFRGGRDQVAVGSATNLPWITWPATALVHRWDGGNGARPTYRGCNGRSNGCVESVARLPRCPFLQFRGLRRAVGATNLPWLRHDNSRG